MLVSRPCTAVAALARLQRSVRRCAASASSDVPSVAVVILPGLGNDASDYVLLSEALMERGAVVRVAPVSRADWLRNAAGVVDIAYWRGTLNPRPTVNWYLERIDVAVASALAACPPGARVSFVAHSAGGWLARVWLQEHGCASRLRSSPAAHEADARPLVVSQVQRRRDARHARLAASPAAARHPRPRGPDARHPHVC